MPAQTRTSHRRPPALRSGQQNPPGRSTTDVVRPHHHHRRGPASLQPVLSIRAHVDRREAPDHVSAALRDIRAYIDEHQLETRGAPFTICHSADRDEIEIEAGWPLTRHAQGTSRIRAGELPTTMLRHAGRTRMP